MSNWKLLSGVALATIATAAIVAPAQAQVTTASVRGEVTNEAGAPVAGAVAVITHTPSGTVSTSTTNTNGVFSARGLRVGGPYTISISGGDFAPVDVTDIYISLDETYPLSISVSGQRTMDTIVVTASQTQSGFVNEGLSTSMGLEALNSITSIDRDITDAAQLDPFATVNTQSGGAKELSIAGANNRFNSLTIDGVALNDRFGLNANGFPTQRSPISFDAIESLSIQTAPYDTEYNGFTGGTINAVTKSGTNEFHGSVFYYQTDDSIAGGDGEFEEKTIGFTVGGPIIKDKLFFFAAYDKYEETARLNNGPEGSGALNEFAGFTVADADQINQIVSSVYGFDAGGFAKSPVEDEKILANLDWNINNNHRAKFTYLKTEGSSIVEQNGNIFLGPRVNVALSSAWYNRSEKVESYIGHLFSDWTPNFSTEVKLAFTDQATGQNSLNGSEFFVASVVLDGTDDILGTSDDIAVGFGPDRFRHGNELDQSFMNFKIKGEYIWGDHTFKVGYEREEVDVDNLFAQNSEGTYTFASLADLQNQVATGVTYNNAITNNEDDLRAIWGYNFNSLYVQDTWDINPDLTVLAGLRYDYYESEGTIRENQNFINRFGFSNTNDIDGLDVVLPRLSFKYDASDDITVRGGIGRFSGGSPGVWISNSYSNDGVINGSVSDFGVINVPNAPDPVYGQYIPQNLLDLLETQAIDGSVNALDPDFGIPSTLKVSLGAAWNVDIGPSEGWTLSADLLYNKLDNATYWYDASCGDPTGTSPDGRPTFSCTNGPEALIAASVELGDSFLLAVSAANDWETPFGDIDLFASYTHADINDAGFGTSSTASSNYSDSSRYSYQVPREGTSNFEVEHLFKLRLNWEKAFFGDYATKASLFAIRRPGQPYSYTFSENNASVFGVRENRVDDAGHLLYVPSGASDPLFAATSFGGDATAQQAFFDYINNSELSQYAGGIAERNGDNSRWSTIVDLRLQQELPGFMENHRTFLFMDIENLGNLLNEDWGSVVRTRYEYERDVVSARIVNGQYEYFNLQSDSRIKNLETLSQSLWQIQLGIKYEF